MGRRYYHSVEAYEKAKERIATQANEVEVLKQRLTEADADPSQAYKIKGLENQILKASHTRCEIALPYNEAKTMTTKQAVEHAMKMTQTQNLEMSFTFDADTNHPISPIIRGNNCSVVNPKSLIRKTSKRVGHFHTHPLNEKTICFFSNADMKVSKSLDLNVMKLGCPKHNLLITFDDVKLPKSQWSIMHSRLNRGITSTYRGVYKKAQNDFARTNPSTAFSARSIASTPSVSKKVDDEIAEFLLKNVPLFHGTIEKWDASKKSIEMPKEMPKKSIGPIYRLQL